MSDADSPSRKFESSRGIKTLVIISLMLSALAAGLSFFTLLVSVGFLPISVRPLGFERQMHAYTLSNDEAESEPLQPAQSTENPSPEDELAAVTLARHDEIFSDPTAPVGGNPAGDVTLVEFFDYNCPYCREAASILDATVQTDKGLRLVFKELPILGPGSTFAAQAALAAHKQGKYLIFHKAMMAYSGAITESSTLQIATDVGLDLERLKTDMKDPLIDQAVQRNRALAQALRISGTPSFVIGREIVRGLVDIETMRRFIVAARER
ncbi:DsbA family protein [Hypericibacter sp.]|uniref:DsbA family protein n=1 Tax=Hypericibacter sp. TaxID=2705401 RepID=UPI003D6D16D2